MELVRKPRPFKDIGIFPTSPHLRDPMSSVCKDTGWSRRKRRKALLSKSKVTIGKNVEM